MNSNQVNEALLTNRDRVIFSGLTNFVRWFSNKFRFVIIIMFSLLISKDKAVKVNPMHSGFPDYSAVVKSKIFSTDLSNGRNGFPGSRQIPSK